MAALTTNTGLFGAKGVSCPATLMKMVDYNRTVDFAKTNAAENTNYDLLPIPKGFLIAYIAVEQKSFTNAGATVTFATKNADTTAIGGNFALAASSALLRSCQSVGTVTKYGATSSGGTVNSAFVLPEGYFSSAADTLCIKVPDGITGDALTKGEIVVHMIGYQTFGESLGDIASGTPAFATGQTDAQALGNVSGGDPMFH